MRFKLTPDRPRPLSAVRVGATSDARWRKFPDNVRRVNLIDTREDEEALRFGGLRTKSSS